MIENILDLFFPKRCLGCGKAGAFVCEVCEDKLPFLEDQSCAVCGHLSVGGFTHERCRGSSTPERFMSLFKYQGVARALVGSFKYEKVTSLLPTLHLYINEFLKESAVRLGEETLVTFVPIHPLKLLERGFNQSEIIAGELGRREGLLMLPVLEKIQETPSQTKLSKKERKENVAGSFGLARKYAKEIMGRDILLVDDVFTTGATLLECSKVLKKAGARFVYLLTLAKD